MSEDGRNGRIVRPMPIPSYVERSQAINIDRTKQQTLWTRMNPPYISRFDREGNFLVDTQSYLHERSANKQEIFVLLNRIRLARIPKSRLVECMHALCHVLFYVEGSSELFTYTETPDEISLILEHSHLQYFPPGILELEPHVWRPLQLIVGPSGYSEPGVVSSLSQPLANKGISIFQVSSHESDIVLVQEERLPEAIGALEPFFFFSKKYGLIAMKYIEQDIRQRHFEQQQSPPPPPHTQSMEILGDREQQEPPSTTIVDTDHDALVLEKDQNTEHLVQNQPLEKNHLITSSGTPMEQISKNTETLNLSSLATETDSTGSLMGQIPHFHPFSMQSYHIRLAGIQRHLLRNVAGPLMEIMFYRERSDKFFSICYTGLVTTILMDMRDLRSFDEDELNVYGGQWRIIRIGSGPLGFEECGIVRDFSVPLAEEGISVIYISTFLTDYVMVGDGDIELAVDILNMRKSAHQGCESSSSFSQRQQLEKDQLVERASLCGRQESDNILGSEREEHAELLS